MTRKPKSRVPIAKLRKDVEKAAKALCVDKKPYHYGEDALVPLRLFNKLVKTVDALAEREKEGK